MLTSVMMELLKLKQDCWGRATSTPSAALLTAATAAHTNTSILYLLLLLVQIESIAGL